MAIPATPTGFNVQQGNSEVLLTWNSSAGATTYPVYRSIDGITYSNIATPAAFQYLDTSVTVGTKYFYKIGATNVDGTSVLTLPQSVIPVITGQMTLSQIRLAAQQRADRVNSNFVTFTEWNSYINQSYFELYDLLVTVYEDYYVQDPLIIPTNGTDSQYDLPTDFYKLLGVDLGLSNNTNAWVTIKKFNFISRNRYLFPQLNSSYLGVFDLRYRLVGNTIMFIPTPSAGQFLRIWYIPRLTMLLQDSDTLDGISGWSEYVIVDAAMKALQKEESDITALMAEKQMLIKRIEDSAMNRDAGQPDTISNTQSYADRWGGYGSPNGDGPMGGY